MNTPMAGIAAPDGREIIELAVAMFEETAAQMGKQTRAVATATVHFTLQPHPSLHSPELATGLLGASASLFFCLAVLCVVTYQLRAWLKP